MVALKKTMAAEPYRCPSLEDADPAYAALLQKQSHLYALQQKLNDERREVERQLAAQPVSNLRVSPNVAKLLGDDQDHGPALKTRLDEIRNAEHDLEAAIEILRRRITDARGPASVAVCAAIKPEYSRRVKAMVAAVKALQAARDEYSALIDDLNANDVAWTSLVPMQPTFCGDRHDGHLERYLRAAKEAGYNNV